MSGFERNRFEKRNCFDRETVLNGPALKGHGFQPCRQKLKIMRALAPEGPPSQKHL
jgi:hypothetical protein